jgi:HSP20 family molecular chaperone IbpA
MSALREALGELPDAVFADVLENDEEYLLVLDLPGVHADTVDVSASRGRLRIEARREKSVPREFQYIEEGRALFLDADFPLPPDASAEGASASVDRGVLDLRLPKRERGGETSIPIEGSGSTESEGSAGGGGVDTDGEPDAEDDRSNGSATS